MESVAFVSMIVKYLLYTGYSSVGLCIVKSAYGYVVDYKDSVAEEKLQRGEG